MLMRQRGPLVPRGRNGNKLVTDRVTLSVMPYRRETGTYSQDPTRYL